MKWILGSLAVLLLLGSAGLWMLRPSMRLPAGSMAPDFSLPDQNGRMHKLADYRGRWLVLYFYPRDDTPGCTEEACRFRDDIGIFGNLNAAIVGISVDDSASHAAFARKFSLPFPLLADRQGTTASAYGALLNLGLMRFARRHTFIITPDGRIAERFDQVAPARHAREVADALRRLQGAG
jgi:peroxiredoxin Q/BCP